MLNIYDGHCLTSTDWNTTFGVIVCIFLPLITSTVCAMCVLRVVHRTILVLLKQTVSIGDRTLTVAHRRMFRRKLVRAVLFVSIKSFVTVLILTPYWLLTVTRWRGCVTEWRILPLLHSTLGPYITLLTQRAFKREAVRLFCSPIQRLFFKYSPTRTTGDMTGNFGIVDSNGGFEINSSNVMMMAYKLKMADNLHAMTVTMLAPVNAISQNDALQMSHIDIHAATKKLSAGAKNGVGKSDSFGTNLDDFKHIDDD